MVTKRTRQNVMFTKPNRNVQYTPVFIIVFIWSPGTMSQGMAKTVRSVSTIHLPPMHESFT